ncbi:Alpha/Beta hydrolase protein [Lasiosphaeria hispida]|uniref:Alpha/Beta hydrolase protein n=1 Tax=Lasiosphaeria hispida TaxID=260671 RepID=A0AAJ0M8P0_9PEZI|nr:Alpha/Beta hydrolase protein [Lasiosphaeria hispida]
MAGCVHTHTIILLHGRDSQACEFASEFFECEATDATPAGDRTLTALFPTIRWVFPQARAIRSERFDADMPQWFDMWSLEDVQERSELQVPGLRSSVDLIIDIIKDEELLVPRGKIFLGGISQGFATSLAALFADGRGGFAGLCGFCSWLPLANEAASIIHQHSDPVEQFTSIQRLYVDGVKNGKELLVLALVPELRSIPILLEHSRDDSVISVQNGMGIRDTLAGKLGFRGIEWHEYDDGGHWINEPRGVDDFVSFLRRVKKLGEDDRRI